MAGGRVLEINARIRTCRARGGAAKADENDAYVLSLARNQDVPSPCRCQVARRKFIDLIYVVIRREHRAVRVAEAARIWRDDEDAFRTGPSKETSINGASARDCDDMTVFLVGRPDLAAKRPEAVRHYSWSFQLKIRSRYSRDWVGDSARRGNTRYLAGLTRHDHVKIKICAEMVEGDPSVVPSAAWDRREQRDAAPIGRDLIDLIDLCDVNVARGPRPQVWRDSHVFFYAADTVRNRPKRRDNPGVGDLSEVSTAVCAHYELIRRSHYGYGLGFYCKGNSNRGVKEPCGRQEHYGY